MESDSREAPSLNDYLTVISWLLSFFSLCIAVLCLNGLWEIYSTKTWHKQDAIIKSAQLVAYARPGVDLGPKVVVQLNAGQQEINIRDLRAGGLPFQISFMGYHSDKHALEALTPGKKVTLLCGLNQQCYLSRGSYWPFVATLVACLFWWVFSYSRMRLPQRQAANYCT